MLPGNTLARGTTGSQYAQDVFAFAFQIQLISITALAPGLLLYLCALANVCLCQVDCTYYCEGNLKNAKPVLVVRWLLHEKKGTQYLVGLLAVQSAPPRTQPVANPTFCRKTEKPSCNKVCCLSKESIV